MTHLRLTNCSRWLADDRLVVEVAENSSLITSNFNNITSTMTTTTISGEDESGGRQVITDAVKAAINLYVKLLLHRSIALFGTCANVVNMIVFLKLGLKDSNSVGLMALSCNDFLITFLTIVGYICYQFISLYPQSKVDPVAFDYVTFAWVKDVAFLISGWITAILSVERCVCVISPFRVRQIFTRNRSLAAIGVAYVVNIAVHMPVFLSQWLEWTVVDCENTNGTIFITEKLILHFSDNRKEIQTYIDIANGTVLPVPSQAIVLVSVIWLTIGLHASSRIRKGGHHQETAEGGGKSKSSGLSGKEGRLVKVVLSVAVILTICNIPRFLAVYAKQIFEEVSFGKKRSNLYVLLWNIASIAQVINSSVNIFVYMAVNSNYRQTVKAMFGIGKKAKDSSS